MSFPKILLPTITTTGIISGSIITISNLSSSTKSNIQNTQLKKNDNSINNIENKEKTKKELKKLFREINKNFNSVSDKFKLVSQDLHAWTIYLKIIDEMNEISTSLIAENIQNPIEIKKKIKEVEKDIKDLSNLLKKTSRNF